MTPNDKDRIIPKVVSGLDDNRIVPKVRFKVHRNTPEPIAPYEQALFTPNFEQYKRLVQRKVYCIEQDKRIVRSKVCCIDYDKY